MQVPAQGIDCFPLDGTHAVDVHGLVDEESQPHKDESLTVYDIFGPDLIPQEPYLESDNVEHDEEKTHALPPSEANLHLLNDAELLALVDDLGEAVLQEISRNLGNQEDPDADLLEAESESNDMDDESLREHSTLRNRDEF